MVRNVLSNWTALLFRALISFILTPFMIHSLGDFHYGLWILVMSVLDYCGILDLGIRPTLHRFVARLRGANQRQALNETIGSALAVSSVVGILVAALYPQFYETTGTGLMIHSGLIRRLVPYEAITFIGPSSEASSSVALSADRIKIEWAPSSEVLIAPADSEAFIADMAARAPQLCKRGQNLILAGV